MKKFYLLLLAMICSVGMSKADFYLRGSWNEWGTTDAVKFVNNSVTIHLDAFTLYEFKFFNSSANNGEGAWSGVADGATMVYGDCTGWWMNGGFNCKFLSANAGDYSFTLEWNDVTPIITASYPTSTVTPVTLENGENKVTYYASYVENDYTLVITSAKDLNGFGGSFWTVPGTGNEDFRAHATKVNDKTYKIEVAATGAPQFYTPLYVLMPGEVNFGQPTINWQEDLGTGENSDLALTSNASLTFDLSNTANLTSQIAYTTSSTGAVTYTSGNNAVATVSEAGLITAVGVGSTAITVSQAADDTYKKGKVVINVTVENTNFGPTVAPTAPTTDAEKVLAIYTNRYELAINSQYKTDNWGSTLLTEERLIGTDNVRIYQMTNGVIVWGQNDGGDNAIRGLDNHRTESYTGLNAAQMEYLHVDIWCDHVRNFTSIINDNGRGAQGETTANTWTSYNVPLSGVNHGETGIENVRWMKFDGFAAGDVVAIANVYFYTTQDLDQAPVLTTFSAKASSQLTKVNEGNTIILDVKDQLSRPINDATITYTIEPENAGTFSGNVYTPAVTGWATITAHAAYDGVTLDAASFRVRAHVGDNVAKSTNINASKVIAQVAENPEGAANAFFAIDGNDGSIWEIAEPAGTENHMFDAWFVVDLGANYDLELATVHFEGASSKNYDIEVSATYNGEATVWTKVVDGASTPGMQNITKIHEFDAVNGVRYVRYFSHQAATGYGHKIYEIQVFGTPAEEEGVTIHFNAGQMKTYSAAYPFHVEGADIYRAIASHDVIELHKVESDVPAGEGVILYSETEADAVITEVESATALLVNDLHATTTADEACIAKPAGNIYSLASDGYFHPYVGTELKPNRAFIIRPELNEDGEVASSPIRVIFVTDEVTAVENVEATEAVKFFENGVLYIQKNGHVYNAMGQLVK